MRTLRRPPEGVLSFSNIVSRHHRRVCQIHENPTPLEAYSTDILRYRVISFGVLHTSVGLSRAERPWWLSAVSAGIVSRFCQSERICADFHIRSAVNCPSRRRRVAPDHRVGLTITSTVEDISYGYSRVALRPSALQPRFADRRRKPLAGGITPDRHPSLRIASHAGGWRYG